MLIYDSNRSILLLGRYQLPVSKGGLSQETISLLKEAVDTQARLDKVKMAKIDKDREIMMVAKELVLAEAAVEISHEDIEALHAKRNQVMATSSTSKAYKKAALAGTATELAALRDNLQEEQQRLARLRALQALHYRKRDALRDLRAVLKKNFKDKAKAAYEAAVQKIETTDKTCSTSNNDSTSMNNTSAVAQDTQDAEPTAAVPEPTLTPVPCAPEAEEPLDIDDAEPATTPVSTPTGAPLSDTPASHNPMSSQEVVAAIKAVKAKIADVETEVNKIQQESALLSAEVDKANKAVKKAKSKAVQNARSTRKITKAVEALQTAEAKLAPVQQQLSTAQATLAQLAAEKQQLGHQLAQALRAMVSARQATEAPVQPHTNTTEVSEEQPVVADTNDTLSLQACQDTTTSATPAPAGPTARIEAEDHAASTPASPSAAPAGPTTVTEAGNNLSLSTADCSPAAAPDSPSANTTPAAVNGAEAVAPVAAAPVPADTKTLVNSIKAINGMMVNLTACINEVEAARAPFTAQVAQATQQLEKQKAALDRVRQTSGQAKAKQASAAARLSGNVTRAQKALQLAQAQLAPWEGKLAAAKATLEDLAAEKARLGACLEDALKALVAGRQAAAVPCAATKIDTSSKVCDIDEAVEGPSEFIAVYNPEGSCCLSDSDDDSSLYSGCLNTESSAEIAGSDSMLSGCSSFRSDDSSSSDGSCADAADAAAEAVAIVSTTTDCSTGAGSPIAITAAPVSRSRLRAEAPAFVPQCTQVAAVCTTSKLRVDAAAFVPKGSRLSAHAAVFVLAARKA